MHLQRAARHAGHAADVVDQGGGIALFQHGHALGDIGAEAARGVEAAAVVDDDRGLLDLHHIVERLRDRRLAGLLAEDDLDQHHLVDGREEVDADEVLGPHAGLGQAGDRQGRGVGAEHGTGGQLGLGAFGDIGLDLAVLEHRLDDQVRALDQVVVGGGGDRAEQGVELLLGDLAARQALLQQVGDVGLALVGVFLGTVDQDGLDAGQGLHIGDARAHHAGADDGDLLRIGSRHAGGADSALVELLLAEEQRADHGLRLRRHQGLDEIAGLDPQGRVHRDLNALIDGLHQVQHGRIVAVGLLAQHGVADEEILDAGRVVGAAAGLFEALVVPRLHGLAAALDPGLRSVDLGTLGNHFMHHARAPGVVRTPGRAGAHRRHRRLHADQAGQALGAAAAGEEADLDLGQAELNLVVVGDDPVVTGQRQLEPAAQRQAVDGPGHRLAAGLQRAQGTVQLPARIIGILQRTAGQHAAGHVTEVGAGAEAARLARGQDRALDGVIGLHPFDPLRDLLHHARGQGVHRPPWDVEGDQGDAVGVDVDLEVFHRPETLILERRRLGPTAVGSSQRTRRDHEGHEETGAGAPQAIFPCRERRCARRRGAGPFVVFVIPSCPS